MVKEIKPPSAEIFVLKGTDRTVARDVSAVRDDLLKLANDIDKIADKTRWPEWSRCQARSMREYANDIIE